MNRHEILRMAERPAIQRLLAVCDELSDVYVEAVAEELSYEFELDDEPPPLRLVGTDDGDAA